MLNEALMKWTEETVTFIFIAIKYDINWDGEWKFPSNIAGRHWDLTGGGK